MEATPSPRFGIRFSSTHFPRILWSAVAALLLIHVVLQVVKHVGHEVPWDLNLVFDVDEEPTVPTWYSSMALLLAAFLVFLVAGAKRRERDRDARYWYGLAAGFAFMSLDEIAAFHEMVNTFVDIEWTLPAGILCALLAAVYAPFLFRLPARSRNRFLVSGAVYLGGAVVVEHFTGTRYFPYEMGTLGYGLISGVEEGLEMAGVVLFIRALLIYMEEWSAGTGEQGVGVTVRVEPDVRQATPRPS